MDNEGWKYACDGKPLTVAQAKRFAVTRDRLLVSCELSEYPFETVIYEASPNGDYVKMGTSNAWCSSATWYPTEKVNLITPLARPLPDGRTTTDVAID